MDIWKYFDIFLGLEILTGWESGVSIENIGRKAVIVFLSFCLFVFLFLDFLSFSLLPVLSFCPFFPFFLSFFLLCLSFQIFFHRSCKMQSCETSSYWGSSFWLSWPPDQLRWQESAQNCNQTKFHNKNFLKIVAQPNSPITRICSKMTSRFPMEKAPFWTFIIPKISCWINVAYSWKVQSFVVDDFKSSGIKCIF